MRDVTATPQSWGTGIGRETTVGPADTDPTVWATRRDWKSLATLASHLGGDLLKTVMTDVTEISDRCFAVEQLRWRGKGIDVPVNEIGTMLSRPLIETIIEDGRLQQAVNIESLVFGFQPWVKLLVEKRKRSGPALSVLNISPIYGICQASSTARLGEIKVILATTAFQACPAVSYMAASELVADGSYMAC